MTLDTIASIANIGSFLLAVFVAIKANQIKNALTINSSDDNSVKQTVNSKSVANSNISQNSGLTNSTVTQKNGVTNDD